MQVKQTSFILFFIFIGIVAMGQNTFFAEGDKARILLDRLEIQNPNDSTLQFSKTKPITRNLVEYIHTHERNYMPALSPVDKYNLQSLYKNNVEYRVEDEAEIYKSKKQIGPFFKTPGTLYEVHQKDFNLAINPVFQYTVTKEKSNNQSLFLNTRGLSLRGGITSKIGFYAYITDNQERNPIYVQQWIRERTAVPGDGYYIPFKAAGGVDYFDARGYINVKANKYIQVAFGYDKNFIGNGYRSLFLSDYGNSNLFFKINTRIWKFNYQNLFMELVTPGAMKADVLYPKKYAAMHHLDLAVTKWLNLGCFEGVIFGRKDHFDFGYLNPLIFYRSVERNNGSFDNSLFGLDAKANVAKRFQLYGQFLLDEFKLSEIRANKGWWANKWGVQAGIKYIDAFGIKNLDLQVEHNRVRPFTYSHRDSVANYTHYNQPLAHPLMANFSELLAIAHYQPIPRLSIEGKLMHYTQGRDTGRISNGSNIFLPNVPPYRVADYGFKIGTGWATQVSMASLLISYEIKENFFLDAVAQYRRLKTTTLPIHTESTTLTTIGIRWNMHRRNFDF